MMTLSLEWLKAELEAQNKAISRLEGKLKDLQHQLKLKEIVLNGKKARGPKE